MMGMRVVDEGGFWGIEMLVNEFSGCEDFSTCWVGFARGCVVGASDSLILFGTGRKQIRITNILVSQTFTCWDISCRF